ncbi:YraN family protein [Vibrio hepatarius]|uniref:YraN family protein n=1 Tax=Vibrio hepatarius TaxID=171383 RepID=UPI001C093ACB|nr:YraN family protein [Vibrio hepatarius]MBU2896992.1 YraN family protein [Vibrio hepatarius]
MAILTKRQSGEHYESMAEQYLIRQGLSTIEKNFHFKGGELDLIMQESATIVFVEVRYRSSQYFGHAAETVTKSKMLKLVKAANVWLIKQNRSVHNTDFRFDIMAIHQQGQQIEWIKNAITQG